MDTGTPPVLPPGYITLWQAMDCIDPGALQEGAVYESRAYDRFLAAVDWVAVAAGGALALPGSLCEEAIRRQRRKVAFEGVRDLCAYGVAPSALLRDDFTVLRGIPAQNWLDDDLSSEMRTTGRTTIGDRPPCISGWVMIDAAAFRAAAARARANPPNDDPVAGAKPRRGKRVALPPAKVKQEVSVWLLANPTGRVLRDVFERDFQSRTNCDRYGARSAYGMLPKERRMRQGKPAKENRH